MKRRMPTFLSECLCLISRYDAFLVDLWGTCHNGKVPFREAVAFFQEATKQGKEVMFLSNSPRMSHAARDKLLSMGLERTLFLDVVTSGEEVHKMVSQRTGHFHSALGQRVLYYGPDEESSTLNALRDTHTIVTDMEKADFILMTDLQDYSHTVEDARPFLAEALARDLPMVCGNADNMCMYGDQELVCSGAVAREYIRMGGKAHIHGKPSPSLYALAHDRLHEARAGRAEERTDAQAAGAGAAAQEPIPKARILMIGDSLETDIRGANAYGIDSLLLLTGIHGPAFAKAGAGPAVKGEDEGATTTGPSDAAVAVLESLSAKYGAEPTYWAYTF